MNEREMHDFIKTCKRGDEVEITISCVVTDVNIDKDFENDKNQKYSTSTMEIYSSLLGKAVYIDVFDFNREELKNIKKVREK